MNDFIAIGGEELGEEIGDGVTCPSCGKEHPVEYGQKELPDGTMVECRTLAFVSCGEKSFLVGIDGKEIKRGRE